MTRTFCRPSSVWAVVIAASMLVNPAGAATFDKCVEGIRAGALKAGIRADIVNAAFRNIRFDQKAVRFSRTQPEYRLSIWDYMASLVDAQRVADGKQMLFATAASPANVTTVFGYTLTPEDVRLAELQG